MEEIEKISSLIPRKKILVKSASNRHMPYYSCYDKDGLNDYGRVPYIEYYK